VTPEDRLAALMEAAVTDLDPPVGEILAEAERRGRRLRRRRRTVLAVVSAGAVLLTAAGVGAGLRLTGPHEVGVADYSDTGPPTSAAPSTVPASPSPSPSPMPPTKPSVPIAITPADELAILHKLLPSWTFSNLDTPSPTQVDLWLNGDDGKGEFTLFIGVASAADSGMDPADCAQQGLPIVDVKIAAAAIQQGCSQVTTTGGDTVMEEVVGAVHTGGYYQYRVIAYRADGLAVEIEATDGVSSSGTVTRAAPPLNPALWGAIATDSAWKPTVRAAGAQ
jgi:hypothetical protein